MRDVKPDAKCANCGRDFADHNYLADSIDKWRCPVPLSVTGYGFYPGGDPRDFWPDGESCTPQELAAHKEACKQWDQGKQPNDAHGCCQCSPFGVGVYAIEVDSFFDEADVPAWEREPWEL